MPTRDFMLNSKNEKVPTRDLPTSIFSTDHKKRHNNANVVLTTFPAMTTVLKERMSKGLQAGASTKRQRPPSFLLFCCQKYTCRQIVSRHFVCDIFVVGISRVGKSPFGKLLPTHLKEPRNTMTNIMRVNCLK